MFVYMGGGIDSLSREEAMDWREEAAEMLLQHGISSFNPVAAWRYVLGDYESAQGIIAVDIQAVDSSHGLIVNRDGAGIGTFREMQRAIDKGKPVVVFGSTETMQSVFWLDRRIEKCGTLKAAVSTMITKLEYQRNPNHYRLADLDLAETE